MRDILGENLKRLKRIKIRKIRMIHILLVLSLIVSLDVFWILRQPGLTLAGDADCKIVEHTHDEGCQTEEIPCELTEHVHSITCYADVTADVETQLDWQNMFSGYPYTGNLRNDLVGIAKTQVGYAESTQNFQIDISGNRHGYTRYGAWYGAPYSDWSAMFVSFCLHYAGADSKEFPSNTGSNSMATLWNNLGKFAPAGTYEPVPGDLVFFSGNTVGIVTEVQSATIYIIRGDVNDTVTRETYGMADASITGWGVTEVTVPDAEEPVSTEETVESTEAPETSAENTEEPTATESSDEHMEESTATEPTVENIKEPEVTEPPVENTEVPTVTEPPVENTEAPAAPDPVDLAPTEEAQSAVPEAIIDLLDISNGPAVFIVEAGDQTAPQMRRYALRSTPIITDLLTYLQENDGSYFYTLLNLDNSPIDKDGQGNYIVQAGTGYKLTISFTSPKGFLPGTYTYQVPNGLMVDGGEGTFILKDGTNVGTWVVTDTGEITLIFNDRINSRTDITISSTLGIHFPEQDAPIDFDGKITVTVEKAPQQAYPTVINKWGQQGGTEGANGDDPTKIYWGIELIGNKDSQIPGSIITDRMYFGQWSKTHHFTESDIAAGLSFGAWGNNGWHTWHVPVDDPHLIWTDTEWTYKMPKTVVCDSCGEIELGNEGWYYYIYFSSTPDPAGSAGTFGYENEVTGDGAYGYSWVNFTHGDISGTIEKTGTFVADASGGAFLWEFRATVPGSIAGTRANYHWYIQDDMTLLNGEQARVGYVHNDANLSRVTATYNGSTIQVPRIQDATEDDFIAWDSAWVATQNGHIYSRGLNLLCRCVCTPENCHWGGQCDDYWYIEDDGTKAHKDFCHCWNITENITFTFVYETRNLAALEHYGGTGYQVKNAATLYYIPYGSTLASSVATSEAKVPIPGLFKKVLDKDFDGYVANYKVTVNEAKLVLTDGSPLTIHDVMTDTLAYISGSLVITAEDKSGVVTTLQQDVDYTVSYDGTGKATDANGNPAHILDIVILHPQPVMYLLDYDTTLIIPEHVAEGLKYTNSATITLWGEAITDTTAEKVYAEFNIAAKSYSVQMFKTCADTGQPLPGATFGLYNTHGGQITTEITNIHGELMFQTSIVDGIILREHELYYMQELKAPPRYKLDDTKYWFCFCDSPDDNCETCNKILAGIDAFRIPFEQIGKVDITNEYMIYHLPETGGTGIIPCILASVTFLVIPLVILFIRRRKQERRDVR